MLVKGVGLNGDGFVGGWSIVKVAVTDRVKYVVEQYVKGKTQLEIALV